jgi:hypothetical protein
MQSGEKSSLKGRLFLTKMVDNLGDHAYHNYMKKWTAGWLVLFLWSFPLLSAGQIVSPGKCSCCRPAAVDVAKHANPGTCCPQTHSVPNPMHLCCTPFQGYPASYFALNTDPSNVFSFLSSQKINPDPFDPGVIGKRLAVSLDMYQPVDLHNLVLRC